MTASHWLLSFDTTAEPSPAESRSRTHSLPALKTARVSVQTVFGWLTAPKPHYFYFLPGKLPFPVLICLQMQISWEISGGLNIEYSHVKKEIIHFWDLITLNDKRIELIIKKIGEPCMDCRVGESLVFGCQGVGDLSSFLKFCQRCIRNREIHFMMP